MSLFTATLSTSVTITAQSPRQADAYAREDALEHMAENSHDLVALRAAEPGEGITERFGDTPMSVVSEQDFDGAGQEDDPVDVEAVSTVTFDVTFEAPCAETAKIMAPGIPARIVATSAIKAVVAKLDPQATFRTRAYGEAITALVDRSAAEACTEALQRRRRRTSTTPEGDRSAITITLDLDVTVAHNIASTIARTDPLLARATLDAGSWIAVTTSDGTEGRCSATHGEPTNATKDALIALATGLMRRSAQTSYGMHVEVAQKAGSATLMAAKAKTGAPALFAEIAAAARIAEAHSAPFDAKAIQSQIPHAQIALEAA